MYILTGGTHHFSQEVSITNTFLQSDIQKTTLRRKDFMNLRLNLGLDFQINFELPTRLEKVIKKR